MALGFFNNFTSGEICDEAWDRTDIQPVMHGVAPGQNYMCKVQGPLAKRRGFYCNGSVMNPAVKGRIVPFRRSIDDALMLEFGDFAFRVWQSNGSPLLVGGVPFQVATPFSAAQVQTLRWTQVGDVIYFTSSDGMQPQTLSRTSNTNWSFADIGYTNGPWRPENTDQGSTVTITATGGAGFSGADTQPTGAGFIGAGQIVSLVAADPIFNSGHVGGQFRFRQSDGSPGVQSWAPSTSYLANQLILSNERVYKNSNAGKSGSTPPVHDSGSVSDGVLVWSYLHDGAGTVAITAVASPTQATGTVIDTLPVLSGSSTTYWSEGAYSNYRGWPTAWPAMREERIAFGSTSTDTDMFDLTQTAGFSPTSLDFTPGTGTGQVIDTNAIRRRAGEDGAPIVWFTNSTYLLGCSESGEYLIAGSVLDEPLTPSAVMDKQQYTFGAADAAPVKAWDGVLYIAQGNQTLRELSIDASQNKASRALDVLASHISERGYAEVAWTRQPDNTLWARLSDGGLAAYVYQKEQNVQAWCSQALPAGFVVEWMAVIPGETKLDTLWLQVSRVKNGATQRFLFMQSAQPDGVFYDAAAYYEGAPETVIAGLDAFDGETVAIMADGAEQPAQVVVAGAVTLPVAASKVIVGFNYQLIVNSLRLDIPAPGTSIDRKQRIVCAYVSLLSSVCQIGDPKGVLETYLPRQASDVPGAPPRRGIKQVTFASSTDYDPRIQIVDSTGYDFRLYSIRPSVSADG